MKKKYSSIAFFLTMTCGVGSVGAQDNPLEALFGITLPKPQREQTRPQRQPKKVSQVNKVQTQRAAAQNRSVSYVGYSEKFQPVKRLMIQGDMSKALSLYIKQYEGTTTDIEKTSRGNSNDSSFLDSFSLGSLGGTGSNTASYDDDEEDEDDFSDSNSTTETEITSETTDEEQIESSSGLGSLFSSFTSSSTTNNEAEAPQLVASKESTVTTGTLLGSVEQGLLSLDAGNNDDAIRYFSASENILDNRKKSSTAADIAKGGWNFASSFVTGDGEIGPYNSVGFEKVLMLNYKSIAYMLDGDRKAYNVTRRSIELQNIEKRNFESSLVAARVEIGKNKDEQQAKDKNISGLGDTIKSLYKKTEARALTVESAYVNPFGYYMAGVVQEFDSYEDRSLRSNALIAYKKALKLNPSSKVLKRAVKDLKKKRAPKNRRLVQIVLGDGFVPEKKVLRFGIFNQLIKLPIYEPVSSRVARVEVQSSSGRKLSTFSAVADIEALALRHQKDSEPFQYLLVATTLIRGVVEKGALKQVPLGLGSVIGRARDEMSNPDMRSWMTLPSSLHAVRMYLPKKQKILQLVSFDSKGKELARKKIELDRTSHNFVYARSIDDTIYVSSSNKLWVALK